MTHINFNWNKNTSWSWQIYLFRNKVKKGSYATVDQTYVEGDTEAETRFVWDFTISLDTRILLFFPQHQGLK